MKTFAKTLLAGPVLAAAGAANAATIDISISYDPSAEADYLALLHPGYVQENFDALGLQGSGPSYSGAMNNQERQQLSWEDSNPTFDTNVGTFTLVENGHDTWDYIDGEEDGKNLKIESAATGEFGREALAGYDGDFWLDSNDAGEVTWDFTGGAVDGRVFDSFGFYLADPADIAAQLTLHFSDGTDSDAYTIPFGQNSGDVGYVTVKSTTSIVGGTLTFNNSADNDGWGIDDVTVGRLPEPGTLLLMGLGLLGLGAARRKAAK